MKRIDDNKNTINEIKAKKMSLSVTKMRYFKIPLCRNFV